MDSMPNDLVEYLKSGAQLSYDPTGCECGRVTLKSLAELELGKVWLNADTKGCKGYLEIPAISLLKSCDGYDPDYILLWLPNEKVFGSWDGDHWELRIFPKVQWRHILLSPKKFLNAQWYDYEEKYSINWYPYKGYKIHPGRPW